MVPLLFIICLLSLIPPRLPSPLGLVSCHKFLPSLRVPHPPVPEASGVLSTVADVVAVGVGGHMIVHHVVHQTGVRVEVVPRAGGGIIPPVHGNVYAHPSVMQILTVHGASKGAHHGAHSGALPVATAHAVVRVPVHTAANHGVTVHS